MTTYYANPSAAGANNGSSEADAWTSLQTAADTAVAGDIVYCKGTFAEQVDWDTNDGTVSNFINFIGYTTTPGDNGKATLTGGASRSHCGQLNGASYINWRNFIFTSPTTSCFRVHTAASSHLRWINCEFLKGSSTPANAFSHTSYQTISPCSFIGCLFDGFSNSMCITGTTLYSAVADGCVMRNMGGNGFNIGSYRSLWIFNSLIYNNTGDGINAGTNCVGHIIGNVIANNGGDGIDLPASLGSNVNMLVCDNIIVGHSGAGDVGFRRATPTGVNTHVCIARNAYYNNTTHRSTDSAALDGSDYDLTANPFVDAAGGDFSINNTAGGGAILRAASFSLSNTTAWPFNKLVEITGGIPNRGIISGGRL